MGTYGRFWALFFSSLTITVCFAPVSAYSVIPGKLMDSTVDVTGEDSVMVEVHTATWCEYCAEIDDTLSTLRDVHDGRMALIALHPSDGTDLLSTLASEHRLQRLHTNAGRLTGTPTIFMEGQVANEGVVSSTQITSSLFNYESEFRARTEIGITVTQTENILSIHVTASIGDGNDFNQTQITIMIGDDEPILSEGEIAKGAGPFDSTLHSLIEVDVEDVENWPDFDAFPNNQWAISNYLYNKSVVSFSAHIVQSDSKANSTTIIVSHEVIEEEVENTTVDTFGTVGIIHRGISSEFGSSGWIIGGCLIIGILILADSQFRASKNKNDKSDSEE